jgi:hypothetical protein
VVVAVPSAVEYGRVKAPGGVPVYETVKVKVVVPRCHLRPR